MTPDQHFHRPALTRKQFLARALGGLLLTLPCAWASGNTHARGYRMLIPANPGGGWDLTGRALGQALIDSGEADSVAYENRGGAAGNIGLAQFADSARGEPHALMVMGSVMLGGIITGKPPVGLDQVRPLARLTNEFNVFVLPVGSPFSSMHELLQQFRKDPASVKWGGGSRGSTEHIAVHKMARALGIAPGRINYVPFRGGGEAAAAIMAGYVTVGGSGLSEFLPYIASGRMRAVAVTSGERLPGSDVPSLRELGLDVVIGNWRGVCAAGGLSSEQYGQLTQVLERAMDSASWRRALDQNQWTPAPLTGAAFGRFVDDEFERMRQELTRAGLT